MQNTVQKTILPSGLTIVSDYIPYVRSVSVGVWIKTGTRFEAAAQMGVSHFLEHMMFKDTERRSARDIVRTIENLGGMINAFTTKEYTCYHVEILDDYLPQAIDVLSDMLCRKDFPDNEFEKERRVILDEIFAMEDTPEEMVQEVFMDKLYLDHSLGYSILGTAETVGNLQPSGATDYFAQEYCAENVVIAVAGNVNHAKLLDLSTSAFAFPQRSQIQQPFAPLAYGHGEHFIERQIFQSHLFIGSPAIALDDPRRFDLLLLNTILGGGMGSRLFQNIREKHGIAYGIYSYFELYLDSGLFGIYLGTDRKNVDISLDLLDKELQDLVKNPVPAQELAEAKSQLKGNIVLGLESTAARMNRLGIMELYYNRFFSIDDVIEKIDNTTSESVQAIAQLLFQPEQLLKVIFMAKNE